MNFCSEFRSWKNPNLNRLFPENSWRSVSEKRNASFKWAANVDCGDASEGGVVKTRYFFLISFCSNRLWFFSTTISTQKMMKRRTQKEGKKWLNLTFSLPNSESVKKKLNLKHLRRSSIRSVMRFFLYFSKETFS